MSLGGILPLDNLGNVTHGSAGVDAGPLTGGAGLDLTGTSAAGLHGPAGLNAGGDVNLLAQSGHVGVSAAGHEVVGVGSDSLTSGHADVTVLDNTVSL